MNLENKKQESLLPMESCNQLIARIFKHKQTQRKWLEKLCLWPLNSEMKQSATKRELGIGLKTHP